MTGGGGAGTAVERKDSGTAKPAPERDGIFIKVPRHRSYPGDESSTFHDVMSHGDSRRLWWNTYATTAHETHHHANALVQRTFYLGRPCSGFYVWDGRAAIYPEPRFLKRDIAKFVPRSLRDDRFFYVWGQWDSDEFPLYVLDEWIAYITDAKVIAEYAYLEKRPAGYRTGEGQGCIEMMVYGLALYRAIQTHDPKYLERNPDFREFLAFLCCETLASYEVTQRFPQYRWQPEYLEKTFRKDPAAAALRSILESLLIGSPSAARIAFGRTFGPSVILAGRIEGLD